MEKAKIHFTEDSIAILDAEGKEIVMWTKSEWEEDSSVVFSIANAVNLAHTDMSILKSLVGK